MLSVSNLHKSFASHKVLQGLDLTIETGSMTAIIGPNGCGKSTLFNLITGELSPEQGDILFNGQSLLGLRPRQIAQRGILRKFQIPGIYPNMSVNEHLMLPFVVSQTKVDIQKINKVAEQMGLQTLMQVQAGVLATGQKQWLEMAMLVLLEPTLLLLDEPIAGMTVKEAEKTEKILKQLNTEGLTIVTIEHNIDFVKSLTEDIAVLMNGGVFLRGDYAMIAQNADVKANYLGSLYA